MASRESSNWRPKAKREGWLVEKAGGEVVFYNVERHRAHCLNDAAVQIWDLCTGKRTVAQIAAQLDLPIETASRELVVRVSLAQFEHLGLIEGDDFAAFRISRRTLVKRIGLGTAAAVALPLVTSIVAPTPAYAASKLAHGSPCTASSQCASGCCCNDNSGGLKNKCATLGTDCNVCIS